MKRSTRDDYLDRIRRVLRFVQDHLDEPLTPERLAICQELAVAMGGRITVESTPGQGTCFIVELPLAAAAEVPRPLRADNAPACWRMPPPGGHRAADPARHPAAFPDLN